MSDQVGNPADRYSHDLAHNDITKVQNHPPLYHALMHTFVVCCLDSIKSYFCTSNIMAQANLGSSAGTLDLVRHPKTDTHGPEIRLSHDKAQINQ